MSDETARSRSHGKRYAQARKGLDWYGELTMSDSEMRRNPAVHRLDLCEVKVVRTADDLDRLWADGWRPV